MIDWIKDLFFKANGDADEVVVYVLIGIIHLNGFTWWNMLHDRPFDAISYGTGFAAIVGGYGLKNLMDSKGNQ